MSLTVAQIISDIIAREGGYVNNPADHGGPTKYGITMPALADYLGQHVNSISKDQIRQLTPDRAADIYLKNYWQDPGINHLPFMLQPILLDTAVNQGPKTAIKLLQKALVAQGYPLGTADGIIGSKTIIAATKAAADLGGSLINSLVNFRISAYNQIVINDPSQKAFAKGWHDRAESFRVELA